MFKSEEHTYSNIEKKSNQILFMWSIIIILLMSGHIMNNSVIRLSALVIGTIVYIKTNAEFKFYLLLYSLPFINFLRIGNESFSFLNIWTIFLFINLVFYNPIIYKFNMLLLLSLLIIISINIIGTGWGAYIGTLINIFLVFMVCSVNYKEKFNLSFLRGTIFLSVGFIMSSLSGLIMRIVAPNQLGMIKLFSATPGDISLKTTRFTGLMVDPNYYAQGVLFCISCILVCMITKIIRKKTNKEMNYLSMILTILILFGLYSYSKMFIITLIVLLFMFGTYMFILKGNINRKIIFIIIVLFIGFVSLDEIGIILGRLSDGDNITSGRMEIFDHGISIISQMPIFNILFGIGISGTLTINTFGSALHNMYLEYISSIGILGTSIWLILLFSSIKYKNRFRLISIYKYLPLIVMLITATALDGLWAKWHYFYTILAIISINSINIDEFRRE